MGLERLLRPRSIAVIGGGAWCDNVVAQCATIGFEGTVWRVHPKRDGAFRSVADLPHAPDATFIGVNRNLTVDVVRALSDMGAGGAICFASGFQEAQGETADGSALQSALVVAAGDMKIIGPNCYGLLNYLDGAALWPDQHGGLPVNKGVAIITQSSNVAINITMQQRGLPIAYMLTAGNQAQTGLSEMGLAMLADPRVTALGLHIEGFDDLRAFEELAAASQKLGKPIVALKVGRSDQARAATISHTAAIAGSDVGSQALLTRLGIGQVTSLAGLIEALKLLHVAGPLVSCNIGSMSCSGGEASLMADAVVGTNLTYPALTAIQKANLRDALGPMVALANPLDYHTYIWGDQAALTRAFTAMMDGPLAIGCVVLDFPRPDRCSAEDWDKVIAAARDTKSATGRPMAIIASLAENMSEDIIAQILDAGLIPLCGMTEGVEAMNAAATMTYNTPDQLLLPRAPIAPLTLTEAEAKAELASVGVRVPRGSQTDSAAQAAVAAAEIGFPVVLKGTGVAHKTEAGAVALGLMNASEVINAAAAMPCDAFLVEEMVDDPVAELLIGVVCDPAHGYVLTIAAGGILAEILTDNCSLLIPASRADVDCALSGLGIARILQGYRGKSPANWDAIVDTVLQVQSYVQDVPVAEMDINPLLCTQTEAIAADALIKKDKKND